ncbi:P-loop containing nucleoside triphosphate hydrolase protein [Cyathus striatus]|nr:P-loop containing nucleoside triphosphate hydrolase protein [Cyathus striatus]
MSTSPDDDAFVNVWFGKEDEHSPPPKSREAFYGKWSDSARPHSANALLSLYPNHSLVMTQDYQLNILNFPGISVTPLEKTPLLTNLNFIPLPKSSSPVPGVLIDSVELGAFKLGWRDYEFLFFSVAYPLGFGISRQNYILHQGPEDYTRHLLMAVGAWADGLHDEIWVFNQGFWSKNHGLWVEVQKADWKDVILKDEFKKALQKDVYGFFSSEKVYKELGIPWKRGLIMHGPPGNGKTISLKTIMKTCSDKGFSPLYVKSFQSYKGEEGAMADVFNKARQVSPCVVILEDLDSLINDGNRSYFLNQMDGLEGNDGLLIIGTTNHFDRLDPGLSTRPSRFDRKYKFDDPDLEERKLYVQYWQKKLKDNHEIPFPDRLISEVADMTDRFSFAYLKEAFVSALVTFAGYEGEDKPTFEWLLKDQIKTLRKQLDKPNFAETTDFDFRHSRMRRYSAPFDQSDTEDLARQYSRIGIQPVGARAYATSQSQYSTSPEEERGNNFRVMLDRLSLRTGREVPGQRMSMMTERGMEQRANNFGDGMPRSP